MFTILELNITRFRFPDPRKMRLPLLIIGIILFVPLHSQDVQNVNLDQLIQNAITRNPEIKNDSSRKDIVLRITENWYNWLYSINNAAVLNEYYDLIKDLDRVARLRYESGDIDYIQYSTNINLLARMNTDRVIFMNKCQQYENTIRGLTMEESGIFPYNTTAELYEINKFSSSSLFPDTLDPYKEFLKNIEIENLQLELDNLFIKLSYFTSVGLPFSEGIRETAQSRLKSEEIEYLEYAGLIEQSLKIQLEYNEVLNQYNQCAIQLEDYAY